eukprot:gene5715-6608_t
MITKQEEPSDTEPQQGFVARLFSTLARFSWTSLLAKVVPTSWTLDPTESFRINTVIQPFNPIQIASSNSPAEILEHWNQLENELYPNLKKIDSTDDKIDLLNKFLNKKKDKQDKSL